MTDPRDVIIQRITALLAEWSVDGPRGRASRPYVDAAALQALADALGVPLTPPCCVVCEGRGIVWQVNAHGRHEAPLCTNCKGRGRAEPPQPTQSATMRALSEYMDSNEPLPSVLASAVSPRDK